MESLKKILPYIVVAVIFGLGGYFIGAGSPGNQGAALFKATPINPPSLYGVWISGGSCWAHYYPEGIVQDIEGVVGMDGGCHFLAPGGNNNEPAGLHGVGIFISNGECWMHFDNGSPDIEGTFAGGGCLFLKARPTSTKGDILLKTPAKTPTKAAPTPTTSIRK